MRIHHYFKFSFFVCGILLSSPQPSGAKSWKGAEVFTVQSFRYGAFEARIRSAKGGGVITPFYLWKDGSDLPGALWQEQGFEIFGRDGSFHSQINTPGSPWIEHAVGHRPSTAAYSRYNTYRMEWTPDSICFYFNARLIRKDTDRVEFAKLLDPTRAHPAQLRISAWAGDDAWSGAFDSSAMPTDVYVNWVQTYAYTPGAGPNGSSFTPLWRDEFDSLDHQRWGSANWSLDHAVSDYSSENVKVFSGALDLALTSTANLGTFRPVPGDDTLRPPLSTAFSKDTLLPPATDPLEPNNGVRPKDSTQDSRPKVLGLVAQPGDGFVDLAWVTSSASFYKIYRSLDGKNFQLLCTVSHPRLHDESVGNGKVYSYRVTRVLADQESEPSVVVDAAPRGTVPSPVTGIVAKVDDQEVDLTWVAATGALSYTILRGVDNKAPTVLTVVSEGSYKDEAVANGATYTYSIVASNTWGDSPVSQAVNVVPKATRPTAP